MVDAVVPARDEAGTVAEVVVACLGCAAVREVIVVDDGSADGTGERAAAAGAKVIRRDQRPGLMGTKGQAMAEGVAASDADAFLFVDADLVGLKAAHLDDVCRPFLEGRAAMSVGWFDYGRWNPVVLRLPPTTGERIVPRWVFEAVAPEHRVGYAIEVRLNEVICEGHLRTSSRIMAGVNHRTKRQKLGKRAGRRETWRMFWHLLGMPLLGTVRARTYWFYLQGLSVER